MPAARPRTCPHASILSTCEMRRDWEPIRWNVGTVWHLFDDCCVLQSRASINIQRSGVIIQYGSTEYSGPPVCARNRLTSSPLPLRDDADERKGFIRGPARGRRCICRSGHLFAKGLWGRGPGERRPSGVNWCSNFSESTPADLKEARKRLGLMPHA